MASVDCRLWSDGPHQAALDGEHDGMGAVFGAEFVEDADEFLFDEAFAEAELGSDELVGVTLGEETEDLQFALGERGTQTTGGGFLSDGRWEGAEAAGNAADGGEHERAVGVFGQIAADAGFDGAVNLLLALMRGEQ